MATMHMNTVKSAHHEIHKVSRRGWIRAFILGANDGIVSMAALMMSLIAAYTKESIVFFAGLSALVAGACSMAIGEYISVSSQRDIEQDDIALEKRELDRNPEAELNELTSIYRARGLNKELAQQVAIELTQHNALDAHLRDELGITQHDEAKPFQAGYVSCIAFLAGGGLPFISTLIAHNMFFPNRSEQIIFVGIITLSAMLFLGYLSARIGGGKPHRVMYRIAIGGIGALVVTTVLGAVFA